MLLSLAAVGGVAYLQYSRVDKARLRQASMEQLVSTKPEPLPLIATLPDFTLIASTGKRVSLNDLRGRVWVADFFFTYCAGPCPVMSRRMKELRQLLKDEKMEDVLCVSISVDPATDTPERLKAWGAKFHAGEGWTFVTGNKPQVDELLRALGVSSARREDHSPTILIGNDAHGAWTRTYGLANTSQLVQIINDAIAGKSATTTAEVSN